MPIVKCNRKFKYLTKSNILAQWMASFKPHGINISNSGADIYIFGLVNRRIATVGESAVKNNFSYN